MAVKKQNLGLGGRQVQKVHHCVEHDLVCQAVRPDNKKMRFRCERGCDLRKQDCVLK